MKFANPRAMAGPRSESPVALVRASCGPARGAVRTSVFLGEFERAALGSLLDRFCGWPRDYEPFEFSPSYHL
jgi:hypothetical protein